MKHSMESLRGVEKTLIIPLLIKAKEYRHKNPILKDKHAFTLAKDLQINEKDFKINRYSAVSSLFRSRQFDFYVKEYIKEHPEGLVIEIGAGLDSRFERVDNGQIRWVNIELPEVVRLRNEMFPPHERVENLDTPLTRIDWNSLKTKYPRPMIIAEGVFPYFDPHYVEEILKTLNFVFDGCALCFDAMHSFIVKRQIFKALKQNEVPLKWGVDRGEELVSVMPGCKILEERRYYDRFHPRNGLANFFRFVPFLNNLFRIYKIQLKEK